MKIVIEISDNHMPFVRQQADLHGSVVYLQYDHFMALLPGKVIGVARDTNIWPGDLPQVFIEPLNEEA